MQPMGRMSTVVGKRGHMGNCYFDSDLMLMRYVRDTRACLSSVHCVGVVRKVHNAVSIARHYLTRMFGLEANK